MSKSENIASRVLIKRLFKTTLAPLWKSVVTAVFFMLLYAACDVVSIKLLQPVIDEIFIQKKSELLWPIAIGLFLIFTLKGVGDYGQTRTIGLLGFSVVKDLRKKLFSHLTEMDIAFFGDNNTGTLLSRFTVDTSVISGTVSNAITRVGKDAASAVFLIGLMFYQDAVLACAIFVIIPFAALIVSFMGKKMRGASISLQESMGGFSGYLLQVFQGIRTVKSYRTEEYECERMNEKVEGLFKISYKAAVMKALSMPAMDLMGGIAVSLVIAYGGYRVSIGDLTPGGFFTFIAALVAAARPIQGLANLNVTVQEGLASLQRLYKIMDIEPSIKDAPAAEPLNITKGEIELRDVTFTYEKESEPVLKNVSLTIPVNKLTVFAGASGAGKSTILNLLLRFYDADSGKVLIEGKDISKVQIESLRSQIAYVGQDVLLFDDTIRANIVCGHKDITDEDVELAAKLASIDEEIWKMSYEYDTVVGELGYSLSGGQRQRISFARAIAKNAPIMLLDEFTSAIDALTSDAVHKTIDELKSSQTIIAVTHSETTMRKADVIYLLDNGKIIGQGTYDELRIIPRFKRLMNER
ncbi:MAG: ABC transporter ATP-binding protein [Alphaproteobacteria bacterium]|nr:ABC transporter ATP-binding protein [Alphaproteobacteria bacterium]